jgi:hypothetical protein
MDLLKGNFKIILKNEKNESEFKNKMKNRFILAAFFLLI